MWQNPLRVAAHNTLLADGLRSSCIIAAMASISPQSETNSLPVGSRRTQKRTSEPYRELVYARDGTSWKDEAVPNDDCRNQESHQGIKVFESRAMPVQRTNPSRLYLLHDLCLFLWPVFRASGTNQRRYCCVLGDLVAHGCRNQIVVAMQRKECNRFDNEPAPRLAVGHGGQPTLRDPK